MEYKDYFVPIALDDLLSKAKEYKDKGFRLSQMHPVLKQDDSITLYYSFVKENETVNLRIDNIVKGRTEVPSLTHLFIAVFVFENEAHDLFGVNIVGNLLDFQGKFYQFGEGVEAPMTIISPEQLAAREKAAKIARAKAAKAAKAKREAEAKKAAEAAARSQAVEDLSQAQKEGTVEAPRTLAGATVPAPQPEADPRYAGFDPEMHQQRSQVVIAAEQRAASEGAGESPQAASDEGANAATTDGDAVDNSADASAESAAQNTDMKEGE